MSDANEVIQRIAERIEDHDILNPHEMWKCSFCGTWGQGMRDYALHLARELVSDLTITREMRWVPSKDFGEEMPPLQTFWEAELMLKSHKDVVRVDREYRFASRWFRPARDG